MLQKKKKKFLFLDLIENDEKNNSKEKRRENVKRFFSPFSLDNNKKSLGKVCSSTI